jgi:hypothetical protein
LLTGFCSSGQVVVYGFETIYTALQYINGTSDSAFGYTLAVGGDYLVVGAPQDLQSQGSGAVYVYAYVATSSGQTISEGAIFTLDGSAVSGDTTSQNFGGALATDGKLLAVGAFNSAIIGFIGAVYIYSLAENHELLQMIELSSAITSTKFAGSMSMSGSLLAVGDYSYGTQNGAVFVLYNEESDDDDIQQLANFTLTQTLTTPFVGARFGQSVSLVGDTLIIAHLE